MLFSVSPQHQKAEQLYSSNRLRVNSDFSSLLESGLTDLRELHVEQLSELFQFRSDVTNADCAVMSWPMRIPVVDESSRSYWEPVATIRISDFKNGPRNRFGFRG